MKIEINNKHDLILDDYNEIMKIEDEMKFATINSNDLELEVNNRIIVNSFWNFFVSFFLSSDYNSHKENEFTNDCDPIKKNRGHHWIQGEKCCQNHLFCIWKVSKSIVE